MAQPQRCLNKRVFGNGKPQRCLHTRFLENGTATKVSPHTILWKLAQPQRCPNTRISGDATIFGNGTAAKVSQGNLGKWHSQMCVKRIVGNGTGATRFSKRISGNGTATDALQQENLRKWHSHTRVPTRELWNGTATSLPTRESLEMAQPHWQWHSRRRLGEKNLWEGTAAHCVSTIPPFPPCSLDL